MLWHYSALSSWTFNDRNDRRLTKIKQKPLKVKTISKYWKFFSLKCKASITIKRRSVEIFCSLWLRKKTRIYKAFVVYTFSSSNSVVLPVTSPTKHESSSQKVTFYCGWMKTKLTGCTYQIKLLGVGKAAIHQPKIDYWYKQINISWPLVDLSWYIPIICSVYFLSFLWEHPMNIKRRMTEYVNNVQRPCCKDHFLYLPNESKVAMQDDLRILVVHRDFTGRPIQIFLLLRFMLPLKHSPVATLYSS